MTFTKQQYEQAIKSLQDASQQLEPDGNCCACCGDSGHQAMECGFNPLVAMAMCVEIAKSAEEMYPKISTMTPREAKERLFDIAFWMAGFEFRMGCQVGPAKIRFPEVAT